MAWRRLSREKKAHLRAGRGDRRVGGNKRGRLFLGGSWHQGSECERSHAWNLSISSGRKSVQPVGHIIRSSCRVGTILPPIVQFSTQGRCHFRQKPIAAPLGRKPVASLAIIVFCEMGQLSVLQGVGQYPHSFSVVGSTGVFCSKHSPRCIIPHRGHVAQNSSKSSRSDNWRVLHKHEFWSNFANHAGHFSP